MYKDLKDRVALITGAGKRTGIGYAVAEKLAQSGSHIVITDIGKPAGEKDGPHIFGTTGEMETLAKELNKKYSIDALAVPLDVCSNASISTAQQSVMDRFGGLDILVNNAGAAFGAPSSMQDYDEDGWVRTFDVNVHGVFRTTKAFLPILTERRGSIINFSSRAGKVPPLFNSAYAAAKAAVIMMTKTTAKETAATGVRVNAVCPGLIMTDLQVMRFKLEAEVFGSTPEDREAELTKTVPQQRIADPSEVASLVAFLASQEASHITGQALNVCGGMTMEL